jgi:predicted methyltransferase
MREVHGFRSVAVTASITLLALGVSGCASPTSEPSGPAAGTETEPAEAVESDVVPWVHLEVAVAQSGRPERDRARDAARKPVDVLRFCGIEPGMVVAELMAGAGYYTQILSSAVGPEGTVYGHNSPFVLKRFAEEPWSARLAHLPLDNVVRIDAPPEEIEVPEPVDAALLIRFYHDFYWQDVDRAAFNARVREMLKPGGVFCVVDHHAEEGSRDRDVETLHRVDAAMVRAEIEAAGFVRDGESDILRRPDDDRTWNIFDFDGERRDLTDRFVYRFRNPS